MLQTDASTEHGRTDNVKTVYPPQTKFAGGIINNFMIKMFCYLDLCFCVNAISTKTS